MTPERLSRSVREQSLRRRTRSCRPQWIRIRLWRHLSVPHDLLDFRKRQEAFVLRPALCASENGTDIAPLRPDRPAKCPEGGFSLATNEAPCFLILHQRHHMSDLVVLARVVTLDFES